MKPSRLIAGAIAGTIGVGVGLAFLLWQGDRAFAGNMNALKIDVAVAFGLAYGLFWLADRVGLLADPFTSQNEVNDVYPETPKDDNHQSV